MSQTITKSIGEGHDNGQLYAALAYNASDRFEGMKVKSIMLNGDERLYFRDTDTYIYSDAAGSLQIAGTTVSVTGTIVPNYNEGFLMIGTNKISFYDAGLYIYSSADGTLNVVADTILALAATTITLTGAITVTGAPTIAGNVSITGTVGITGDVTMATSDQINFYDSGAYIKASASTALAIVATTIGITGATTHTGAIGITGAVTMATTSKLQFHDTNAYINATGSTALAIVATTLAITGATTHTGALGMTGAITMATTSKIQFHDTGLYIYASQNGQLDIVADITLALASAAITLTGATTHTGALTMATTSRLQFHDTGMYIYASGDGAMAIAGDTALAITCPTITITASTALVMASTSKIRFLDDGLYIYSSANGVLDIVTDGTLVITSAAVTITGAPTITGALTVGVDDTGHDVKFYGAGTGKYWLWDENGDTNGQMVIVASSQFTGAITVGINDTGYDVKFFGAASGAYMLWDESDDDLVLVGAAGLKIGAAAVGITFNGANTTACISMDGATLANGDHEIELRNNVAGDKTVICSGAAANDGEIVTAVGADADIADGSLYLSCVDGAGDIFLKINDTWTSIKNT